MPAYKSISGDILDGNDNLIFWFQCKRCGNRWVSSFCYCICGSNNFKIFTNEEIMEVLQEEKDMDYMLMLAKMGRLEEQRHNL